MWLLAGLVHGQAAAGIDLMARSDWKLNGVSASRVDTGVRIAVNPGPNKYGWAEIHLPLDVTQFPLLRVKVFGANRRSQWTLKIQFPPHQEEWLITDNDQNGSFAFPIGEYLERYDRGECIVRFFAIGVGASVVLQQLELVPAAAERAIETVSVDEMRPLQHVDGGGGQADYPLWTIGKQVDHVSSQEIHTLLSQLQLDGVSVARVGAYGDVIDAATKDPSDTRLKALVHHIKSLKEKGIKTLFVAWFPAQETLSKPSKTDAWRDSCVAMYAQLLSYCSDHGAPISYFELQNEPHANLAWWSPDFLGQCGLALAKECEKRGLSVEIIGPDGWDDDWVAGWAKAMGKRGHIIALKAGADRRGTREMTAHHVAASVAKCQDAAPFPHRYWLTEYGDWGWGNPDVDRRAENGPCDGTRYGTAMAELTHFYLAAGISCPSIWELYDVRRIDEVAGKQTPEPPKRWGMVKYKTEAWRHRAHFDTLGHYYRALIPGSTVYASSSTGGLLPTAVRTSDGWRIILFNRFKFPKSASVRLPPGEWQRKAWWVVSDPERGTKTFDLEGASDRELVSLPPYGIGTIVLGPKARPKVDVPPDPFEPAAPSLSGLTATFLDPFIKPKVANWRSFDLEGKLDSSPPDRMAFDGPDVRFVTNRLFAPKFVLHVRIKATQPENCEITPIPWFGETGGKFAELKLFRGTSQLWDFDKAGFHEVSTSDGIWFPASVWHDVTIQRSANRITMWVDSKFAWDYEGDDLPLTPGHVGIRGHGFEIGDFGIYAEIAGPKGQGSK